MIKESQLNNFKLRQVISKIMEEKKAGSNEYLKRLERAFSLSQGESDITNSPRFRYAVFNSSEKALDIGKLSPEQEKKVLNLNSQESIVKDFTPRVVEVVEKIHEMYEKKEINGDEFRKLNTLFVMQFPPDWFNVFQDIEFFAHWYNDGIFFIMEFNSV